MFKRFLVNETYYVVIEGVFIDITSEMVDSSFPGFFYGHDASLLFVLCLTNCFVGCILIICIVFSPICNITHLFAWLFETTKK